jgi:hypothetical protein
MIEQIERSIFFRFTRLFAWLLIIPAIIAFGAASVFFVKNYFAINSPKPIEVKYAEVKLLVENKDQEQKDQSSSSTPLMKNDLDSKTEATINEIIMEFKTSIRKYSENKIQETIRQNPFYSQNYLRSQLEQKLSDLDKELKSELTTKALAMKDIEERKQFFSGLLDVIKQSDFEDKGKAYDQYNRLWQDKKATAEESINRTKNQQTLLITVIASSFASIALFSLLLVLLSIERNTRNASTPSPSNTKYATDSMYIASKTE